jgi:protein tyrosine phosphatase (PTP) superfamily phosphohydrolase (DUF442 family)
VRNQILFLGWLWAALASFAPADDQSRFAPVDEASLPNAIRVHERVISGGVPEGEKGFAALEKLGIRTIISVDGAKPDVELAHRHGMRYVHLPHGYDGVPEARGAELAKAVRDLPGPVYVHCHHGKHRSPAATAVACVGAGLMSTDDAERLLALAGTSPNYRGLLQSAQEARRIDDEVLDAMPSDFPEQARLPALAEAMVQTEHVYDRLVAIERAGWKTPADQPALIPEHEALLLREAFTEMLRMKDVQARPARFVEATQEAEKLVLQLETLLRRPELDAALASQTLKAVTTNCKACHQVFRDVPLSEKPAR